MSALTFQSDESAKIKIESVHLNLWVLTSITPDPECFLDIGLRFNVSEPLTKFKVDIISDVSLSGSLADSIVEKFTDQATASLVFGEEVTLHGTGELERHGGQRLKLISAKPSIDDKKLSILLEGPFEHLANDSYYTRVRVQLANPANLINIGWSLPFICRYLIDMRINDPRQTKLSSNHMLSIERVQFFLVAPVTFLPTIITPNPKHIRSLESKQWKDYLGRPPGKLFGAKFLTYYWDQDPKPGQPTRFLASLHRDTGVSTAAGVSTVLFWAALIWGVVANWPAAFTYFETAWSDAMKKSFGVKGLISLGSILALGGSLSGLVKTFQENTEKTSWLRKMNKCFSRWLYSMMK